MNDIINKIVFYGVAAFALFLIGKTLYEMATKPKGDKTNGKKTRE